MGFAGGGIMNETFRFLARNPAFAATNVRALPAVIRAMRAYRKAHPYCEFLGKRYTKIDVHHKIPVHVDPLRAGDPSNFISLSRFPNAHLIVGHMGNWRNWNARVAEICAESPAEIESGNPDTVRGLLEIIPSESGKTWMVQKDFTVAGRDGRTVSPRRGFVHDRYTFAPNLADEQPAIVHDFAGTTKRWDNGDKMTYLEWNDLIRFRMEKSWDARTRKCATAYWLGVTLCGWWAWWNAK